MCLYFKRMLKIFSCLLCLKLDYNNKIYHRICMDYRYGYTVGWWRGFWEAMVSRYFGVACVKLVFLESEHLINSEIYIFNFKVEIITKNYFPCNIFIVQPFLGGRGLKMCLALCPHRWKFSQRHCRYILYCKNVLQKAYIK